MFHQLRDELNSVSNEIKEVRKEVAALSPMLSNEITALFSASNAVLSQHMESLRDYINVASRNIKATAATAQKIVKDVGIMKDSIQELVSEALSAPSHSNEELMKQEMRQLQDTMISHFKLLEEKQEKVAKANKADLKALQLSLANDLTAMKGGLDSVLDRVEALQKSQQEFHQSLTEMAIKAAVGDQQCRDLLTALEMNIQDAVDKKREITVGCSTT